MSYWGSGPTDNDYAFDSIGAQVVVFRDRMFADAKTVIERAHPEQSLVAAVTCLRLLDRQFPKCVRVSFGRRELERAETTFGEWLQRVDAALPPDLAQSLKDEAGAEFERYRVQLREVAHAGLSRAGG